MRPDERAAILALFDRLAAAEPSAAPRDPEAEALIRQKIAADPAAPYRMAQTIIGLEQALAEAEARRRPAAGPRAEDVGSGSTSFLGGAAQTALAVAGGVLLADLISDGIGSVAAAAPGADPAPGADAAGVEGDGFDLGGMLDIFN